MFITRHLHCKMGLYFSYACCDLQQLCFQTAAIIHAFLIENLKLSNSVGVVSSDNPGRAYRAGSNVSIYYMQSIS